MSRIDSMIRRRARFCAADTDERRANALVICALKGGSLPKGALPPEAPAVPNNAIMRAWLPTLNVRDELALNRLEQGFCTMRQACLGAAEPLHRLKAVDAVRRSLIVAVGRGDYDVAECAMQLLNDLGACDEQGYGLCASDCSSLEVLDAALDAKVRPLEYWLAVHYFERRWLIDRRRAILRRSRCA